MSGVMFGIFVITLPTAWDRLCHMYFLAFCKDTRSGHFRSDIGSLAVYIHGLLSNRLQCHLFEQILRDVLSALECEQPAGRFPGELVTGV